MKILLPIDGSELALHEVRFALSLAAEGLKTEFLLANVQEPASLYEIVTAHDPQVLENVSHAAGEHMLQPALELLRQAGFDADVAVVTGDPAHAVVDLVEEHACDLIIIGTHAMGLLRKAWSGSVALDLVKASPVPVLVVKPPVPPEPAPEDTP
ncbi:MAG: universal stress protein [Burkholderiaceae bacterium]|jgi:nucleotide-binding universal stress UspA family protein|nr:universal stress protein [Burkholderiaceae bacterium]